MKTEMLEAAQCWLQKVPYSSKAESSDGSYLITKDVK